MSAADAISRILADRSPLAAGPYVLRHGGRSDHAWRLVPLRGRDPTAVYEQMACALRQGSVRLVGEDDRTIAETHAPRLRTRW